MTRIRRAMLGRFGAVTTISLTLVSALAASAQASDYVPRAVPGSMGRVCVERFEENGSLNIWPLRIEFGGEVEARLSGGTATCTYLPAGSYEIKLTWEDAAGKRQSGGSVPVRVTHDSSSELAVCNTRRTAKDDREWGSGWTLAPVREAAKACGIAIDR